MARPVSKAQARRRAAEIRLKVKQPAALNAAHQRCLDDFSAAMTPADTREAVLTAVTRVCERAGHISGLASFRRTMTDVCALAMWAVTRGLDLDVETLMNHSTIDEFSRTRTPRQSENGQALRARRLKNLASEINPGATAPPRLIVSGHQPVNPPYTAREEAAILRIASTQRRPQLRRRAKLAIALARGAGASPNDLRNAHGRDIDDRGDEGVFVTFGTGPAQRTIPVRRRYEGLVREGMTGVKPNAAVLGNAKNAINRLLQSMESLSADTSTFDLRRLRTGWIAEMMGEPIPLSTLLAAAGLRGPRTIADVYAYLADAHQADDTASTFTEPLRGGAA